MKAQLVTKSFTMTGIRMHCLYKNFHQALDREEIFYYGRVIEDEVPIDGLQLIHIADQAFVMATHMGVATEIWKGYNAINEFLKENSLEEDKASYAVELYDSRFNPESNESDLEIYLPVKKTS